MLVEEDFTSHIFTLAFDTGKRVELTREESIEYEKWVLEREKRARQQ